MTALLRSQVEKIDLLIRTEHDVTADLIGIRMGGIKRDSVLQILRRAGREDLRTVLVARSAQGWSCGSSTCKECGARRRARRSRKVAA